MEEFQQNYQEIGGVKYEYFGNSLKGGIQYEEFLQLEKIRNQESENSLVNALSVQSADKFYTNIKNKKAEKIRLETYQSLSKLSEGLQIPPADNLKSWSAQGWSNPEPVAVLYQSNHSNLLNNKCEKVRKVTVEKNKSITVEMGVKNSRGNTFNEVNTFYGRESTKQLSKTEELKMQAGYLKNSFFNKEGLVGFNYQKELASYEFDNGNKVSVHAGGSVGAMYKQMSEEEYRPLVVGNATAEARLDTENSGTFSLKGSYVPGTAITPSVSSAQINYKYKF